MLSTLDWLRPAPKDFRDRAAAIKAAAADATATIGEDLIRLATHNLDDLQLARLGKIALGARGDLAPIERLRLGLIGDGTLSLLGPVLTGSGLRHGQLIEVIEGNYGNAVEESLEPSSHLHAARLDFVLLALDYRLAGLDTAVTDADAAQAKVDDALARVRLIVSGLARSVRGPILVQTVPPPAETLFGSFDRVQPGSPFAMVAAFNAGLAEKARKGEIVLVDMARLATVVGLEHWHDPRHWHASKLTSAPAFLPVIADVIARTLAALRGRAKKVLVLDLDNTLWGGIIGDDGVEGIKLGQGSGTGEAFVAIQQLALALRQRGIVLAVCSKNEDSAARLPFREHPEMILREDHIAVFQANWTDKASNLRVIANMLNLGIDSLVFLDDNPVEREQVRQELPLVGVPEVGDDPALYPRILSAAGYFETVAFSAEDRVRADLYQSTAAQAELMASTSDMASYLASLDMVCTIGPIDASNRARASQLANKSNQYNLTTRRYTEVEMAGVEADPARFAMQVRLADRFGDHGLISVIIADKAADTWSIDTWLMSCRVLGRRVQEAALAALVDAARAAGAHRLVGTWLPSAKNAMVRDHYARLGFVAAGDLDGGGTRWELDLATYQRPELPMRIADSRAANLKSDEP
jgi:FkbH-like protein